MTQIYLVTTDLQDANADWFVEANDPKQAQALWEREESVIGMLETSSDTSFHGRVHSIPAPGGSVGIRSWAEPGGAEVLHTWIGRIG